MIFPGATHLFEERGALEEVARLACQWSNVIWRQPNGEIGRSEQLEQIFGQGARPCMRRRACIG